MSRLLKIAVIGTRGFPNVQGGVESHCENLYPKLADMGMDITVFTRKPYIKNLSITEWNNIKFVHIWAPKKKSFEAIVHTTLALIKAKIMGFRYIHFHAIGPALLVPIARLLGMHVVFTHHGPDYRRAKWNKIAKFILKLGEYAGCRYANQIIAISKGIQSHIKQKFARHAHYIPNGLTLPEIDGDTSYLKTIAVEPKRYIFSAARFVPEKGLDDLIHAYANFIDKTNSDWKLVIAGDADHETDYSSRLKTLARSYPGVILTGFVSGSPLRQLFANAGLFVLPSYYEGLPIALLEAISYRLPVLVSDIPQHRELGLPKNRYFETGNIDSLTEHLIRLTSQPTDEKLNNRIEQIITQYDWKKSANQTLNVYKLLASR